MCGGLVAWRFGTCLPRRGAGEGLTHSALVTAHRSRHLKPCEHRTPTGRRPIPWDAGLEENAGAVAISGQ